MARPQATERLRFTARSMFIAVGLLGATLAGLRLFASATRVIGWIVTATVVAGMLYPLVAGLARWIPRALALLVVLIVTVGGVGLVAYRLVDTLVEETHVLQASAPRAAADLEQSERYGDLARRLHLAERTEEFVRTVPQRLRGGSPADAFRSAATRGVAFLATGVLSLFFLLHGPRTLVAALRQIHDEEQRQRLTTVGLNAYRKAWIYIAGNTVIALIAGLVAYATANVANVPGALPLAVWVALWDIVPIIGVAIGAAPIVILAATLGSGRTAIAVAGVLLAYNVFEVFVLQRFVEARSLRVGPFITIVGGLVGVELYGAGGGLLTVGFLTLGAAALTEIMPMQSPSPSPGYGTGPAGADGEEPVVSGASGASGDGSAEEQAGAPQVGDLVERDERAHAAP